MFLCSILDDTPYRKDMYQQLMTCYFGLSLLLLLMMLEQLIL